jgi:hypothetical protein
MWSGYVLGMVHKKRKDSRVIALCRIPERQMAGVAAVLHGPEEWAQ